MNLKYIITSALLFILGQGIVWIQVNGPIIWPWAKEWRWALMFLGVPITYVFMEATKLAVTGFEGAFWPGITIKTATCLTLAVTIIFIQLFWK